MSVRPFAYCRAEYEMLEACNNQCEHCETYYSPLEEQRILEQIKWHEEQLQKSAVTDLMLSMFQYQQGSEINKRKERLESQLTEYYILLGKFLK